MAKIIKLTESDLEQIIKKVLKEDIKTNVNPKNLKFGDRGPEVEKLQQRLIDMGVLILRKGPTGYFGDLTQRALARAQGNPMPPKETGVKGKVSTGVAVGQGGTKTQPVKGAAVGQGGTKTQPGKQSVKSSYSFTPRIDQELEYIKQRGLGGSPFFIYDPKENLLFLFESADKFVAKTQVVDGADMQKQVESSQALTIDDWCKVSGLDTTPYKCTDPKTKTEKHPAYWVLEKLKDRFLPKGIYKISSLSRDEGYSGKGNNVWSLTDTKSGKRVSAAIHGIPSGIPSRLKASSDLEALLKSDIKSGKVPQEYLNAAKTIASANQSFGCVGIPATFVESPQVKSILEGGDKWYKKSVKVFVMGDTGKDYLVQNSVEFFDKLSGNGQFCTNPESLASRMSSMA